MRRHLVLAAVAAVLIASAGSRLAGSRAADCVTPLPGASPFIPPFPFVKKAPSNLFWHGNDALWTWLRVDGRAGRRDTSFWWHPGYNGRLEQRPSLRIEATERLSNAHVASERATNAEAESLGGWAMLTMLDFPQAGCWSVTASYRGASVSYVVAVD